MTRDDIIRMAKSTGLKPWTVWLFVHRLNIVVFFIWLLLFPLLILGAFVDGIKEGYREWRSVLRSLAKHNSRIQKDIRARRQNV